MFRSGVNNKQSELSHLYDTRKSKTMKKSPRSKFERNINCEHRSSYVILSKEGEDLFIKKAIKNGKVSTLCKGKYTYSAELVPFDGY